MIVTEDSVDSPVFEQAELKICVMRTSVTAHSAKTRESVAKSPEAVNEKNAGLAWGKAYDTLLQIKDTGR